MKTAAIEIAPKTMKDFVMASQKEFFRQGFDLRA